MNPPKLAHHIEALAEAAQALARAARDPANRTIADAIAADLVAVRDRQPLPDHGVAPDAIRTALTRAQAAFRGRRHAEPMIAAIEALIWQYRPMIGFGFTTPHIHFIARCNQRLRAQQQEQEQKAAA